MISKVHKAKGSFGFSLNDKETYVVFDQTGDLITIHHQQQTQTSKIVSEKPMIQSFRLF